MLRLLDFVAYCEINLCSIYIDCVWPRRDPICTICPERAKTINKTTNTANKTKTKKRLIKKNKLHTHQHKVASDELTIVENDNKML